MSATNPLRTHQQVVIAHHLVLTGYGFWLANDPRGSNSADFYDLKFEILGPIHHGRKPEERQPTRDELRAFYRAANPLLNFDPIWIDDAKRRVIAEAFGEVVRKNRYTCYACAICSNHMHLVIRRHRDTYEQMWTNFTQEARARLVSSHPTEISAHHPVFANRPYSVYLYTPADMTEASLTWKAIRSRKVSRRSISIS